MPFVGVLENAPNAILSKGLASYLFLGNLGEE